MLKRLAALLLMILIEVCRYQAQPFSAAIEDWAHLIWRRAERLCTPSLDFVETKIGFELKRAGR